MSLFRDYVTSTAFHLTLSNAMVDELLSLESLGYVDADHAVVTCRHRWTTIESLKRRGLVWSAEPAWGCWLTDAGIQVVELLKVAGFEAEKGLVRPALPPKDLRTVTP